MKTVLSHPRKQICSRSRRTGRRLGFWAAAIVVAAGFSGCVLLDLGTQGKDMAEHGVVAVQVSGFSSGHPVSYVMAVDTGKSRFGVVAAQQIPSDGLVAFLLPMGRTYNIAAFIDRNGNRRYDAGEPSGWMPDVKPRVLANADSEGGAFPLAIGEALSPLPPGLKLPSADSTLTSGIPVSLGTVTTLSNPKFSVANGVMGLWKPYQFLEKLGWGLYFLQPYNAEKIPVVFVYGIGGSPLNWKSMIAALDQSKYQPWIFFYPSGIRLEKAANALSHSLQILRQRHHFSEAVVVAHSMGGLVSRGAVEQAIGEAGVNFIPKLITLCTPWGGDSEADGGVKHLKYPVPAWIDMEPGSKFLRSIFAHKLPVGTRHYLIFDYQTHSAPWLKPDNDGVVQVASELFHPAQAEAVEMFGFNYGHEETLGKKDVHAKVNQYLAAP